MSREACLLPLFNTYIHLNTVKKNIDMNISSSNKKTTANIAPLLTMIAAVLIMTFMPEHHLWLLMFKASAIASVIFLIGQMSTFKLGTTYTLFGDLLFLAALCLCLCIVEKEEAFAMAAMGIIPLIDMSRAWNTWKSKKGQCEQLKGNMLYSTFTVIEGVLLNLALFVSMYFINGRLAVPDFVFWSLSLLSVILLNVGFYIKTKNHDNKEVALPFVYYALPVSLLTWYINEDINDETKRISLFMGVIVACIMALDQKLYSINLKYHRHWQM